MVVVAVVGLVSLPLHVAHVVCVYDDPELGVWGIRWCLGKSSSWRWIILYEAAWVDALGSEDYVFFSDVL